MQHHIEGTFIQDYQSVFIVCSSFTTHLVKLTIVIGILCIMFCFVLFNTRMMHNYGNTSSCILITMSMTVYLYPWPYKKKYCFCNYTHVLYAVILSYVSVVLQFTFSSLKCVPFRNNFEFILYFVSNMLCHVLVNHVSGTSWKPTPNVNC